MGVFIFNNLLITKKFASDNLFWKNIKCFKKYQQENDVSLH
jgi:hypothetical protein